MTEIAPGMMVECIDDYLGHLGRTARKISKGNKYFCIGYGVSNLPCKNCSSCKTIRLQGVLTNNPQGWCITRFKPIGGDKEIEKEKFEELKPLMIPEYLVRLARG